VIAVIGSGPAGVAAASALLARGREVVLLDAGVTLEPGRRALVERMAAAAPEDWRREDVEALRGGTRGTVRGVPLKFAYGSDYPYREVERWLPFENRGSDTRPTLARGGFSSVWGAAVLPYSAEDLDDWPISAEELAPHYRAALRLLPLSARVDDLADELPLYAERPRPLHPGAQARSLMEDLERRRARLRAAGLRFGWSRLAVRAEPEEGRPGCAYCGLCLHGCPYGLIYDSAATLAQLQQRGGFHYRDGVIAERLEETPDAVVVHGRERPGGAPLRIEAERVLVACGAVGSTRLLLASLEAFDRPVEILDSQYFLLPLLRFTSAGRARDEALHTLSQVFLELRHASVTPRNVHLQVYGYNPLYRQALAGLLGPAARPLGPLLDAALARVLLVMGYLHSDVSPRIVARLRRDGRLLLGERRHPETRPTLRRVLRHLARHAGALRALPAAPLLRVAPAGRGFHSGGSLPMRRAPGELECDVLGRPTGLSRVHAVDSTTFPTIPSTTITLSVMANAHRIASALD
jgi:choline dehydrogenase-like flavoprotein